LVRLKKKTSLSIYHCLPVVLYLCGECSSYGDAAEPDKSEQTSQGSTDRSNTQVDLVICQLPL